MDANLAVIVPAFNEAPTLGRVLHRVLLQPCVQQLVVVDDGSADGTIDVAQGFLHDRRVSVYRHAANRGKGAAIRTAIEAVNAPLVIIQDADLEYDPLEYQIMISPLLLRTELMRRLSLHGDRFDIEPEITARILRLGYRIHEVPITYYARGREEGKKLTWVDGARALGTLLRLRLSSRQRLFGIEDPYHARRLRELALKPRLPELPGDRAA